MTNEHAILTQTEIDKLIEQLSQVSERSYNAGFQAAASEVTVLEDNKSDDYTTGYNQGVKIGYERGVSDAWDIIKRMLNKGNEELDLLLKQSSLDIAREA